MRGLFGTMLMEIAPNLTAEYSAGSIGIMSMMIFMTGDEYDRAADIRAAENAEMRALFAEAAGLIEDAALKAKLAKDYSDKFASPYQTASTGSIDEVIEPASARATLIDAFELLRNKKRRESGGPGNIPL
jgi:acetyl-CoA carboxylase carboxyltransferase component